MSSKVNPNRSKGTAGPDGYVRSKAAEDALDEVVASALRGPSGDKLMKYLRQITIEAVAGPEITDHHLRHLEGMRYLVAIIERRRETGKELRRAPRKQ